MSRQEGLQAQRRFVEQLRAEAAVPRVTVSECLADVIKFCEHHQESDVLLHGFAKQSDNPFREKGGCSIF